MIRRPLGLQQRLTNGIDRLLTDLRVQVCSLLKSARGFSSQTNDNKMIRKTY